MAACCSATASLKAWCHRHCFLSGAATGPNVCLTSTSITVVTWPHEIAQSWYEADFRDKQSMLLML